MARDALQVLKTLRRREIDQARLALAGCLSEEARAAERIAAIDAAATRDRTTVLAAEDGIWFQDMFTRRLRAHAADHAAAAGDLSVAQTRSEEARVILVAARTSVEAVATLLARRAEAAATAALREEQRTLDDIAKKPRNDDAFT